MGVTVNRGELAAHLGLSEPTIDRMVREGCPVIKRGQRGVKAEFDLTAVIQWWGDRKAREAAGDKPTDLDEIDKRTASAKMQIAELELAQKLGEVALVRDFERAQSRMMAEIRANILNVPARAVMQLLGCTDEAEFKTKLRAELTLALEQSANAEISIDDSDDADDDDSV